MVITADLQLKLGSRPAQFTSLREPRFVALLFATMVAIQAFGFLVLGTEGPASGLADIMVVIGNLVAVACVWPVYRNSKGVSATFWFLFGSILLIWLLPNTIHAYDELFALNTVSDSTWRLLYCLYGAPILMITFLPDAYRRSSDRFEIFLDLFQVGIVVALIYSTFFFLPARRLLPEDAFLRNVNLTDAQSAYLLFALLIRLQLAKLPAARRLLQRFGWFLLICALFTLVGDLVDLRHNAAATAWYNLVWCLNQAAPALIAVTWKPTDTEECVAQPASFPSFLGINLVLIAMLTGMHLLLERWKTANGELITDLAVTAFLLAFTFRLSLTQFHQQEEIAQRQAAQLELTTSNGKIYELLADAHRQASEITQISELGSLLHACTSENEVFRLIPERMRRLFPGGSGSISLFSRSKNHLESAAEWGISRPAQQIFAPEQCWALRRGCAHVYSGAPSDAHCSHLTGEGPSVCIPLVANGDAIGVLSLQRDDPQTASGNTHDADVASNTISRRHHLGLAVAEHIALSMANINLRESLRLQAVRDPLTGLYNRRYMQEFLERELHAARRKRRPLAVMMLDLDHFKRYNDTFGHSAGDLALAAVGEILSRSVRAEDIACRYGGEEFCLILPECSLAQAIARADEIRQSLHRYRETPSHRLSGLTLSVGVAAFDETTDHVDLLLKFADSALYEAKRAGRDRVVAAHPAASLPDVNFTGDDTSKSAASA